MPETHTVNTHGSYRDTRRTCLGPYVTSGEAALLLQVHISTVRRWAESGALPCVRNLNGHRRFLRSDLDDFAHNRDAWQADLQRPTA